MKAQAVILISISHKLKQIGMNHMKLDTKQLNIQLGNATRLILVKQKENSTSLTHGKDIL